MRKKAQKNAQTGRIIVGLIAVAIALFIWHAVTHPPCPITTAVVGPNTDGATVTNTTDTIHDVLCTVTGYNVGNGLMGNDVHDVMVDAGQSGRATSTAPVLSTT